MDYFYKILLIIILRKHLGPNWRNMITSRLALAVNKVLNQPLHRAINKVLVTRRLLIMYHTDFC